MRGPHSLQGYNIRHLALLIVLAILFVSSPAAAELKQMSDNDLSDVYAGYAADYSISGFSNFDISDLDGDGDNDTLAIFNIHTSTYTEIDSLKLGYHDEYDYKNPTPSFGWDEDWEDVQFGGDFEDPSQDWKAREFYFMAIFDNIDDPANRELKSIKFGANDVEGEFSANFIDFSGLIDDSDDNTPEYNGHALNLGNRTITAGDLNNDGDASEFSISLSIDGYDKGYWVTFTEATVTP